MHSSPVIDVHTHMMSQPYLDLLREKGAPKYTFRTLPEGGEVVDMYNSPFLTLFPAMLDYEMRIKAMDQARVDIAIVSLTSPSCYFGDADVSLRAAQIMNDSFIEAQRAYPDRIRWLCSLPWQYPELARQELKRCLDAGAVGVMVMANIDGNSLTDPAFVDVWQAIDDAALPVLIHPTAPPAVDKLDMRKHNMVPPVGFVFDTTMAISRMIYDGFFDRFQKVKIIGAHGGGALPFIAGRLDLCYDNIPTCAAHAEERPTQYLRRIYVDSVVHRQDVLQLCVNVCGPDNVLYGSDYPHNIGDMTGCLARVDSLDGDLRHAVRGRNAERLFKL
ncbi:amidohydrolase family protein [Amorphus orientalis]|uniref:Aminocarboxymuconate-semialdehyde decarboxylase n=1 Tax=Amorphus orientalis TaxID=649198 RepID=A0AAE4AS32_9HYPH|nr:amidohydrolase family protein [Amorphus orientalis]MDQ0314580.1 aminocarboxymuconate-semialdehyde decarboxylase [Amorphus orientalis]